MSKITCPHCKKVIQLTVAGKKKPQTKELVFQNEIIPKCKVDEMLDLFKDVNPAYKNFFCNKAQRSAMERLIALYGVEKVEGTIRALPEIVFKPYAPRITTPYQLEQKLGDLIIFHKQSNGFKKNGVIKI